MPEQLRIAIAPAESVSALVYPAAGRDRVGLSLVLAHGAGAGQTSSFMVWFAAAIAARGIDAVTFNFSYMERGRRIPDPNARLQGCYRAVIENVRDRIGRRLAIGGKSMGGRIASQVAAAGAGGIAGLVFLGYPLHPPGKPHQLRTEHLADIRAPMLFVQGSRDAFGTPDEVQAVIAKLGVRADLHVVNGGDHSFKVPKRAGIAQEDVYETVLDRMERWLRQISAV